MAVPALTAQTKGLDAVRELDILSVEMEARRIGSAASVSVEVLFGAHRTVALPPGAKQVDARAAAVAEGRDCQA